MVFQQRCQLIVCRSAEARATISRFLLLSRNNILNLPGYKFQAEAASESPVLGAS